MSDIENEIPDWIAPIASELAARFPGKDLHAVPTALGAVVLLPLTSEVLDAQIETAKSDRIEAANQAVRASLAYPDVATFDGYLASHPLMALNVLGPQLHEQAMGFGKHADCDDLSKPPKWVTEGLRGAIPANIEGLHAVDTSEGVILLRNPTGFLVNRYQKLLSEGSKRAADERFVLDCADRLFPDQETIKGWFKRRVLMPTVLADKLQEWASGAGSKASVKLPRSGTK